MDPAALSMDKMLRFFLIIPHPHITLWAKETFLTPLLHAYLVFELYTILGDFYNQEKPLPVSPPPGKLSPFPPRPRLHPHPHADPNFNELSHSSLKEKFTWAINNL